jgi:hypothetical protein
MLRLCIVCGVCAIALETSPKHRGVVSNPETAQKISSILYCYIIFWLFLHFFLFTFLFTLVHIINSFNEIISPPAEYVQWSIGVIAVLLEVALSGSQNPKSI